MKNFRTFDLSVKLYRECVKLSLPRHLKDQLQRASSSVVLNLAEGRGRMSKGDQRRFYQIAFGSLRESQAILHLVESDSEAFKLADIVAAHLYKLIKSIR